MEIQKVFPIKQGKASGVHHGDPFHLHRPRGFHRPPAQDSWTKQLQSSECTLSLRNDPNSSVLVANEQTPFPRAIQEKARIPYPKGTRGWVWFMFKVERWLPNISEGPTEWSFCMVPFIEASRTD